MRYYLVESNYESVAKLHKIKASNGIKAHKKAKNERSGKNFIIPDNIVTRTVFVCDDELTWDEQFEKLKF